MKVEWWMSYNVYEGFLISGNISVRNDVNKNLSGYTFRLIENDKQT